jgi:hypothetical protein
MNLDAVAAGKNTFWLNEPAPQPARLSFSSKQSLRPAYRASHDSIDRVLQEMAAKDLCGGNNLLRLMDKGKKIFISRWEPENRRAGWLLATQIGRF